MKDLTNGPMLSRRTSLKLLAGGTAAAGLAITGCGSSKGGGSSSGSGSKKKTISIEFSWSKTDARNIAMTQIAKAFTAQTGIKVMLPNDSINYNNIDKLLLREVESNKQPDISCQYDYTMLELAQAGAIQSLDQYIGAWPAATKNDFNYPLSEMSVAGHTYGLRYSPTPDNLFYYRKDVYDSVGQKAAPTTFDEWVHVSQEVTTGKRNGLNVPFVTSGTLHRFFAMWTPMIWAGGGDLYDSSTNKTLFQEEPGVKAAQWFQDMVYNTKIIPKSCVTTSDDIVDDQFTAGTTVSITGSPGNASGYVASGVKDLGSAPMPNFANGSTVGTAFGAFQFVMVIPKGAQTDEAWEFINFTQQPAAQLILAKQGQLPTRQSVLSDPFFKTPAAQPQLQIIDWLKMNPHKAPLDIPQYPELLTALGNAFQDILAKKANVAQALQSAAQAYQSAGS